VCPIEQRTARLYHASHEPSPSRTCHIRVYVYMYVCTSYASHRAMLSMQHTSFTQQHATRPNVICMYACMRLCVCVCSRYIYIYIYINACMYIPSIRAYTHIYQRDPLQNAPIVPCHSSRFATSKLLTIKAQEQLFSSQQHNHTRVRQMIMQSFSFGSNSALL
jgi:hypothetical protein